MAIKPQYNQISNGADTIAGFHEPFNKQVTGKKAGDMTPLLGLGSFCRSI